MTEVGIPQDENKAFHTWLSAHLTQMSNNDRAYLDVDGHEELETPTAIVEEIILSSIKETPRLELSSKVGKEIKAITEGFWAEIQEERQDPLRCNRSLPNYVIYNATGRLINKRTNLLPNPVGILEQPSNCINGSYSLRFHLNVSTRPHFQVAECGSSNGLWD